MEFDAQPSKIRKILKANVTYLIPDFQREYSWDDENLTDFWSDLNTASDFFFGSFVMVGKRDDSIFLVLDGQQRLTTVTILLSVIRELFKSIGQNELAQTAQSYIVYEDDDKQTHPILKNETPYPFFSNLIQEFTPIAGHSKTDEEKLIAKAKDFFKTKITDEANALNDKQKEEYLKELRNRLLDINVIRILVDTLDNAHTIFETLNNRGKDLEVIDLVKNYIFKKYPPQVANNKNEKWKEIIKDIKGNKKQFFNHFWASYYEKATQSKQYKSFLKFFENSSEQDIHNLLELIISHAKLYKKIIDPQITDYKEKEKQVIYDILSNLSLFEVEQVRIFILSLMYEFENVNSIKLADAIQTLKAIEKFHFIFNTVCKSKPSGIELMYSKYAIKLHKNTNKKDVLRELIKQLYEKLPTFNEYKEKFSSRIFFLEDKTVSDSKQKKLVRYVLSELEYRTHNTSEFKLNDISIEHLYPKSMKWGKIEKKFISSIGNLLLLDRQLNNELKDTNYENKKAECLGNTKLNTTIEVLNKNQTWGAKQIENREQEIIACTYESFKLELQAK